MGIHNDWSFAMVREWLRTFRCVLNHHLNIVFDVYNIMMRYDVAFVKRLYNQIVKVNIFLLKTDPNQRERERGKA